MSIPDLTAIRTYLSETPWQVQIFEEVASTNTLLKELGRQGAPGGTVIVADRQTGGRGRLGRTFLSPGGVGVYLSALIRPDCAPTQLMHLTCAVAVVMCDAVENAFGFRPGIKWTNDLVYGKKKLAGILTELGLSPKGAVDYAIIGIGINCCQDESDFPDDIRAIAGSLRSVTGHEICRERVAAAMLDALYKMDQALLTQKASILNRYRADCVTLGKEVSVVKADGSTRHGTVLDIDDEGALVVQFPEGAEVVNSGEVSIRGMYGYV